MTCQPISICPHSSGPHIQASVLGPGLIDNCQDLPHSRLIVSRYVFTSREGLCFPDIGSHGVRNIDIIGVRGQDYHDYSHYSYGLGKGWCSTPILYHLLKKKSDLFRTIRSLSASGLCIPLFGRPKPGDGQHNDNSITGRALRFIFLIGHDLHCQSVGIRTRYSSEESKTSFHGCERNSLRQYSAPQRVVKSQPAISELSNSRYQP